MSKIRDLLGLRSGRLTAVARGENDSCGRSQWLCECECGGKNLVKSSDLARGKIRSCGCLGRETRKANGDKVGKAQVHAFSKSAMPSEYGSWEAMQNRCYRPQARGFANYGGRGITVCDAWRESFERFALDMGPRPDGHSLERIDNSGHYNPANCRWATRTEQARNRRNSRMLTYLGETLTLAEWAQRAGMAWHTLYNRVCSGWDDARAITEPVKQSGGHK